MQTRLVIFPAPEMTIDPTVNSRIEQPHSVCSDSEDEVTRKDEAPEDAALPEAVAAIAPCARPGVTARSRRDTAHFVDSCLTL